MSNHRLDSMESEETDINFKKLDIAIGIAISIILAVVVIFIAMACFEAQKPTIIN